MATQSFSKASKFITGAITMETHIESFERLTVPQPWSEDQIKRLFYLRNSKGWNWAEIATDLGRTESGVKSKFKYVSFDRETKVPSVPFVREPIPDIVLIDRARRLAASARDIAGAVFGDPPVGHSALDGARR